MRITVGGILVVVTAGGILYLGSSGSMDWVRQKTEGVKEDLGSLVTLFRSGGEEAKKPEVPPKDVPVPSKKDILLANPQPAVSPPGKTDLPLVKAKAVAPAKPAVVKKKAPAKKKKAARKKKKARKKTTAKRKSRKKTKPKALAKKPKSAPVKKQAAQADPAVQLVGTYVEMELATGRTVKGILEAKTNNNYTLRLPGMGPFKYKAADVRSVKPAK